MKAFDLSRNLRWLFCMTHPDDELGMCAWIKKLADQGNDVFISWSHTTPIRAKEAFNAGKILGIPEERLYCFHARDGYVAEHIPELLTQFKYISQEIKPDRIVTTAFEQGHIDHDATNYVVNKTFDKNVLEFPLYYTYLTRRPVMNRFAQVENQEIYPLDLEQQRFKVSLCKQYPSQKIWRNVLWYEIWQAARLKSIELRKSERMRFQLHKDFLTPHLPPQLTEKVIRCEKWKRWKNLILQYEG